MKNKNKIYGWVIIVLGISMLIVGASLFGYHGPRLNYIVSQIGMYSFLLWLPTIIVGIVIINVKPKRVV